MTSVWRREAALKKTVRDITRISCFVTTMKLLHVLQIFYSSFCVEVYVVARFKVRQQQTIGEVANSIMCLRENYFVCNSERIIKIRHYLLKLCSYEERSSFFDLQCIIFIEASSARHNIQRQMRFTYSHQMALLLVWWHFLALQYWFCLNLAKKLTATINKTSKPLFIYSELFM